MGSTGAPDAATEGRAIRAELVELHVLIEDRRARVRAGEMSRADFAADTRRFAARLGQLRRRLAVSRAR